MIEHRIKRRTFGSSVGKRDERAKKGREKQEPKCKSKKRLIERTHQKLVLSMYLGFIINHKHETQSKSEKEHEVSTPPSGALKTTQNEWLKAVMSNAIIETISPWCTFLSRKLSISIGNPYPSTGREAKLNHEPPGHGVAVEWADTTIFDGMWANVRACLSVRF